MDAPLQPIDLLKARFGYDRFLPLQEEIIANAMAGGYSLVLMPTGGGKSLCFQLPALLLDGLALVVSPLISLMKDQVDGLVANGVEAALVNSAMSYEENRGVLSAARRGAIKILYVAPERLAAPRRHCFSSFRRRPEPSPRPLDAGSGAGMTVVQGSLIRGLPRGPGFAGRCRRWLSPGPPPRS